MTKIITCNCVHEYQDKKHGKQKRVGNWSRKEQAHRCTVCGKLHKP